MTKKKSIFRWFPLQSKRTKFGWCCSWNGDIDFTTQMSYPGSRVWIFFCSANSADRPFFWSYQGQHLGGFLEGWSWQWHCSDTDIWNECYSNRSISSHGGITFKVCRETEISQLCSNKHFIFFFLLSLWNSKMLDLLNILDVTDDRMINRLNFANIAYGDCWDVSCVCS